MTAESGSQSTVTKPRKPGVTLPDVRIADEVLAHGQGERPTVAELAQWLGSADCPDDAVTATCDRLAALLSYAVRPPLELHDGVIVAKGVAISVGALWDEYRGAVDAGHDVPGHWLP